MIKNVSATNFLSWKRLNFDVSSGVTLIDGWNEDDQTSEGSGKSAILNAISWCLYGKIPKDAKMDDVIKYGEKSCDVEVVFDDGTVIKRQRGPNNLDIFVGNVSHKGKDARETQELIEQYIGLSFETFCQTIYFAQNYAKKFITANQEEKGKILSEVQDLTVFDRARKETLELLKRNEKTLVELKHKNEMFQKDFEILGRDIQVESNRLSHVEEQHKQKIKSIQDRIESEFQEFKNAEQSHQELSHAISTFTHDQVQEDALQAELEAVSKNSTLLEAQSRDYTAAQRKRELLELQCNSLANRYKEIQRQLTQLQEFIANPTETCKACGTVLENVDTGHAQAELTKGNDEAEKIKAELVRLGPELETPLPSQDGIADQLRQNYTKQQELQASIKAIRTNKEKMLKAGAILQQLEQTMAQKNQNMEELKNALVLIPPPQIDKTTLELLVQKQQIVKDSIADLTVMIEDKDKYGRRLETLKSGFKEIKSYVFNVILNEINGRVHQYLSHLFEVPVTVRFRNDNMKIETDVTLDGAERGLGLLSGGQFRRVSLAVDLALSDVITARKGSKLGMLILDEYFKDLSESSMEKCLTLLESRGQPVLLIEHNSIFKNIVNNTFVVRLREGTSSVEA